MPKGIYEHKHKPWNKGLKVRLSPSGEFKKGSVPWNKGIKHSEETKRKVSETKKNQHRKMTEGEKLKLSNYNKSIGKKPPLRIGKDSNFWKGGISFEVYPVSWKETLKRSIRERDRYTCQICYKPQGSESLSVHHIDYNKKNCSIENLVTLCRSCHVKTNFKRNLWIEYFNIWKTKNTLL
jgi:hypothetical protein